MVKPRINIEIDEDLKRQAQQKAFDKKETLTSVIIGLLRKWLKK